MLTKDQKKDRKSIYQKNTRKIGEAVTDIQEEGRENNILDIMSGR